jgi:glycosyltransferase involved in cell wall biosynthesis
MLQAMASGLPVVGVKSRGLLEHITPGKSGLLADVGNPADLAEKIISLLEDQELGEKLGKGALEFAHRFSLPKIISEWENVYEEMRNTTRKG